MSIILLQPLQTVLMSLVSRSGDNCLQSFYLLCSDHKSTFKYKMDIDTKELIVYQIVKDALLECSDYKSIFHNKTANKLNAMLQAYEIY